MESGFLKAGSGFRRIDIGALRFTTGAEYEAQRTLHRSLDEVKITREGDYAFIRVQGRRRSSDASSSRP
jgi:hypothetical protein